MYKLIGVTWSEEEVPCDDGKIYPGRTVFFLKFTEASNATTTRN